MLMTLVFALGIAVIGVRASPLTSGSDVLGAVSEGLLGQAAYEICKPLDDGTISVCRPLTEDDDVDEDDEDDDDDDE
jgi:hypothetical protein